MRIYIYKKISLGAHSDRSVGHYSLNFTTHPVQELVQEETSTILYNTFYTIKEILPKLPSKNEKKVAAACECLLLKKSG